LILTMTFGVVLFTILIQGISVEPLDEDRRLAVDGGDARATRHAAKILAVARGIESAATPF